MCIDPNTHTSFYSLTTLRPNLSEAVAHSLIGGGVLLSIPTFLGILTEAKKNPEQKLATMAFHAKNQHCHHCPQSGQLSAGPPAKVATSTHFIPLKI